MAVSATIVHAVILALLLMRMAGAPPPVLRQATVTYYDLPSAPDAPPSPAPSRASSVTAPPTDFSLPELRINDTFAPVEPLTLSITPQELNLSALSSSLPTVRAGGPRTALPVLLNEDDAERELHQRIGSVDRADTVRLHILVERDGRVGGTRVGTSSGDATFDRIASEIISATGRFLPAHQGGVPLDVWVEFPVIVEPMASAQ